MFTFSTAAIELEKPFVVSVYFWCNEPRAQDSQLQNPPSLSSQAISESFSSCTYRPFRNPPPPHSQNSLKDKLKLVPLIKILAADGNDVDVMWPVRAVCPLQWTVPELTNPGQRGVTWEEGWDTHQQCKTNPLLGLHTSGWVPYPLPATGSTV